MPVSLLVSLVALAAAQTQLAANNYSVDEPMPGPILVWSDELDGDALDQSKWSFDDKPGGRGAWPFDEPFHLILNLAIGGAWAGAKGIDDASLPQRFEVDYVRVWKMPE